MVAQDVDLLVETSETVYVSLHISNRLCLALQYSYTGTATDKPLMSWLDDYTFPAEARHAQLALARSEYLKLIDRLLANGTTTAMFFATLSLAATQLFAELLHQV